MNLAQFRKSLGISQEECARQLGVKSKGYISDIERGARQASLGLALKIEQWSSGKVRASSLNKAAADLARGASRRATSAHA